MDQLRETLLNNPDPVGEIIRAIALPKEFGKGFRLASEGAGMPSAVADLSEEVPIDGWATATTDRYLPAGQTQGFCFANALRAAVVYQPNPGNLMIRYDGLPATKVIGTESIPVESQQLIRAEWRGAHPAETSLYNPHGDFLAAGHDQAGRTYLWADNAAGVGFVEVNFANPASANDMIFANFVKWNGKTEEVFASGKVLSGNSALIASAPPGGGYVSVYVLNYDPLNSFTMNTATTGACWAHRTVTNFDSIAPIANGIRTNSAAMKLQNSATADSKNGKIISANVSKAIPWQAIATGYNTVSQMQNNDDRVADNGNYVFLVPDSDQDFDEFYDDVCTDASPNPLLFRCSYPLSERRPYRTIAANVPVAAGRAFTWEIIQTIEYQTNKMMVEQGYSQYTEEQQAAAVRILRTMEQSYENPTHIGAILATIGKYLPRAAGVASNVLRFFGEQGRGLAALVDDNTSNTLALGSSLQAFKKKKK